MANTEKGLIDPAATSRGIRRAGSGAGSAELGEQCLDSAADLVADRQAGRFTAVSRSQNSSLILMVKATIKRSGRLTG
jgi:hypothetical protein